MECIWIRTSSEESPACAAQFPGPQDEEGEEDEPEGVKQARAEGRTPEVDKEEEAAAPEHEYEFKPQVQ